MSGHQTDGSRIASVARNPLALAVVAWVVMAMTGSASVIEGYNHYRVITITNYPWLSGDLANFPVLVRFTSTNFSFTRANPDGHDLRFTAMDGITLLDYERERHVASEAAGEYWVNIPTISATTTTQFRVYYRSANTADGTTVPTNPPRSMAGR